MSTAIAEIEHEESAWWSHHEAHTTRKKYVTEHLPCDDGEGKWMYTLGLGPFALHAPWEDFEQRGDMSKMTKHTDKYGKEWQVCGVPSTWGSHIADFRLHFGPYDEYDNVLTRVVVWDSRAEYLLMGVRVDQPASQLEKLQADPRVVDDWKEEVCGELVWHINDSHGAAFGVVGDKIVTLEAYVT